MDNRVVIAGEKGCGWRWKRASMVMGKRIINKEPEKNKEKKMGHYNRNRRNTT